MKRKSRPRPGTVVQISLPDGRYAYGRVYGDAGLAVYVQLTTSPGNPPLGSREFLFNVGVYDSVLTSGYCPIVGEDPFLNGESPWPPPKCIMDVLSGASRIYHEGKIRSASPNGIMNLEVSAVWSLEQIVERIINGDQSKYLRNVNAGRKRE
jgi:hypothetical protein